MQTIQLNNTCRQIRIVRKLLHGLVTPGHQSRFVKGVMIEATNQAAEVGEHIYGKSITDLNAGFRSVCCMKSAEV